MSTKQVAAVCVLISGCLVRRAFTELCAGGTPELDPFPPADSKAPAASALATAGSHRVNAAGIRVVLDERTLGTALSELRAAAKTKRLADVAAFEQSVRARLGPAIERVRPGYSASFDEVVTDWLPDVIVACDQRVFSRYDRERTVVRPLEWVRNCIAVARIH